MAQRSDFGEERGTLLHFRMLFALAQLYRRHGNDRDRDGLVRRMWWEWAHRQTHAHMEELLYPVFGEE